MAYSKNILVSSVLDKYSDTRTKTVCFHSTDVSIFVENIETRVEVNDVEQVLNRASAFGLIKPYELAQFEKAVAEFIGEALINNDGNVTIPRGIVDYIAVLMYYRGERWCISKLREAVSTSK